MKKYEEMKRKADGYRKSLLEQIQLTQDALDQAKKDLEQLNQEEAQAVESGDSAVFAQKQSEIQMKQILLQKQQDQLDQLNRLPFISAPEFDALKEELRSFTNRQLEEKYQQLKGIFDNAIFVLKEIEQINQDHMDTYGVLDTLTANYAGVYSDTDHSGIRYYRSAESMRHRMLEKLRVNFLTNTGGNLMNSLTNLIELGNYV